MFSYFWSSNKKEEPSSPSYDHHVVFATFNFKDAECRQEFETLLDGPDGLVKTRAFKGCRLIQCLTDNADETKMIIRQEWDSQADHEAYYQTRVQSGMIDMLAEKMDGPIDIVRLSITKH